MIFIRGDTTMEGPKVPSVQRGARREALERRGGWSLGRDIVAPPSMGVWGHSPQKIFEKSTLKSHIFLSISNVWRVTPFAKQSSVCNSGAKFFFNPWRGDIHPCPPSGYAPAIHHSLHSLHLMFLFYLIFIHHVLCVCVRLLAIY